MIRRNAARVLIALATVLAVFGSAPAANADPGGSGYIYYCNRISITGDYYQIAFKYIYTCSNGPMDGPSYVVQKSTYTGKTTGKIGGECAWYAHYKKGWSDPTRIWNWCLTNPPLYY
jgi:hypothetical protein